MLICQLSDLHMCAPGQLAYGKIDTNAMSARAFAALAAVDPAPAAVLVTGDLVEGGSGAAYAAFLDAARRHLGPRVYVVPGNHDDRDAMRSALAGLPGVAGAGAFIQYVVEDLPVRIVMLDTQVPGQNHGALCAERLDFLDRTLAAAPERPTLIAMHHPPFACGIGFMDADGLRDPGAFAAVVGRHPQVGRIVCGHVHRAITGAVAGVPAVIAPSPCHHLALALAPGAPGAYVFDPPAFAVHRWTASDGFASHLAFVGPSPGPFPFTG